tara:strand:- start:1246 stop:1692 length:447 start_codon:yes stop_codon:yes gene_type:complete
MYASENDNNMTEDQIAEYIWQNTPSLKNQSFKEINEDIREILSHLPIGRDLHYEYTKALTGYILIQDPNDLIVGRHIRWINLANHTMRLNATPVICSVKETSDGEDILVSYKNPYGRRFFSLRFSQNIIFQLMNDQEQILYSAMDYVK